MYRMNTSERLCLAATPVVETLEGRQLFAGDASVLSTLPFALEFDGGRGGLADVGGRGTGFTWAQPNKSGTEYRPALVDLRTADGVLNLTPAGSLMAGGPWENDNTLVNGLQTAFDATRGFTVTTRLKGPLGFINTASEQGGLLFGPDQDNYIKLVAVAQPTGQFLQFIDEHRTSTGTYAHAFSGTDALTNVGVFDKISTLDLSLIGDPSTGKVTAYYRLNGGVQTKLRQEITLSGTRRARFFSAAAKAGLIAMQKNDLAPITVSFDRFAIERTAPVAARPAVTASRPASGQSKVALDAFVAADVELRRPVSASTRGR